MQKKKEMDNPENFQRFSVARQPIRGGRGQRRQYGEMVNPVPEQIPEPPKIPNWKKLATCLPKTRQL